MSGKQKLVNFIKNAVKDQFEELKESHEELKREQEQLRSNIKSLASDQLELMNLVMRHHGYISYLQKKHNDLKCKVLPFGILNTTNIDNIDNKDSASKEFLDEYKLPEMDDQMLKIMQHLMGKCKEQIKKASIENFFVAQDGGAQSASEKDFLNNNNNNQNINGNNTTNDATPIATSASYQILKSQLLESGVKNSNNNNNAMTSTKESVGTTVKPKRRRNKNNMSFHVNKFMSPSKPSVRKDVNKSSNTVHRPSKPEKLMVTTTTSTINTIVPTKRAGSSKDMPASTTEYANLLNNNSNNSNNIHPPPPPTVNYEAQLPLRPTIKRNLQPPKETVSRLFSLLDELKVMSRNAKKQKQLLELDGNQQQQHEEKDYTPDYCSSTIYTNLGQWKNQ